MTLLINFFHIQSLSLKFLISQSNYDTVIHINKQITIPKRYDEMMHILPLTKISSNVE